MNKEDLKLVKEILKAKIKTAKRNRNMWARLHYQTCLDLIIDAEKGETKKLKKMLNDY